MPGLLTCKPQILCSNHMLWAPDCKLGSSHLTLTECPPDAPRSFWRFFRGTAPLRQNTACATQTSLICATECAGYLDLQVRSSPGLEPRAKGGTQVRIQCKTRVRIPKWPSKKLPRTRRVPLNQACWKWSQSSLLFWLKAGTGVQLHSAEIDRITQNEVSTSSSWRP